MKSNVLKSSIATLAFTLAIVASFAFSSGETVVIKKAIQTDDEKTPCEIVEVNCDFGYPILCTHDISNKPVYELKSGQGFVNCVSPQLYEIPE